MCMHRMQEKISFEGILQTANVCTECKKHLYSSENKKHLFFYFKAAKQPRLYLHILILLQDAHLGDQNGQESCEALILHD